MSTTTRKTNYLRFNPQSIQGRFIYLLSIIASAVGILLAINYFIIKDQHKRHDELLEVWIPTHEHMYKLSILIEDGKLDEKSLLPHINALNSLANHWQDERLLITYEAVLDYVEKLKQKKIDSSEDLQASEEYSNLHTQLQRMEKSAKDHFELLSTENLGFVQHIKWLFIWEYLAYLIVGFLVSVGITLSVMSKIRNMKRYVTAVSSGNFADKMPLQKDEFQTIANSLNQLVDNLKEITHFAGEVGRGNMDATMNAFDEGSELGRSLSGMRDSLKRVAHEDKNRRWVNEGIAKFAQIIRQHNGNVNELSGAVIGSLVKYVNALQGAIFITDKEGTTTIMRLSGCYAYDRQKYLTKSIPVDSGLIGQAYLEKLPKYLREIPKNYETITTGLGQGSPESILMLPLLHEEGVEGILELASMRPILEFEMEFLTKIAEGLGSAIAAVRINEETRRLLEESQGVAEELRAQEEEMRQNMEEMQATQEEMSRTQRELGIQETNLYAFINNTTDSIITITRDYKVGLINEVLKNRYKGTQYEGIDTGSDILPTLGAVAEEWKGYYDRAFAGEHLDFAIESSVQGENTWREYNIHPIRAKHGEIVAVSVISRDTTQKVMLEMRMKQKSTVLANILEQAAEAYIALDSSGRVIIASTNHGKLLPELKANLRENDKFLKLLPAAHQALWEEQLEKVQTGEKVSFTHSHNSAQNLTISIEPLRDDNHHIGVLLRLDQLSN